MCKVPEKQDASQQPWVIAVGGSVGGLVVVAIVVAGIVVVFRFRYVRSPFIVYNIYHYQLVGEQLYTIYTR